MKKIMIGSRYIGNGEPLYFIADIAANHDGDLNRAYKLIELAKEAGADAAKFQNFQVSKIVSKTGFERLGRKLSHQASWNKPVYQVYKDASLSFDWTAKLKEKCVEVDIEYLTSPYDFESVDRVDRYLNAYKIGSGDITWLEIIEYIARKGKPVMIASGASDFGDVERAMALLSSITDDIVLMQCNTNYTGSRGNYKYINLNVLKVYGEKFPNSVFGLSDHMPGHAAVVAAVALGARVFEKHFTDDNERIGPDHRFAMTQKNWRNMVKCAAEAYDSLGDGIKKIEENERDAAIVQRRSLHFTNDLPRGHILRNEDLVPLRPRPDDGMAPYEAKSIIGKILVRDVEADDYIRKEDVKDA